MGDGLRRPADLAGMALGGRLIGADFRLFRVIEPGFPALHVHGHVHQHRAGAAALGNVKSFLYDAADFLFVFHQVAVLDKGLHRPGDVRFLEHVPPQQPGIHLAGEDDQGDGIHVGGGNAAD